MGKIEKYGSYVCKVGYLDVRQKIIMPRLKKTNRGDIQKYWTDIKFNKDRTWF